MQNCELAMASHVKNKYSPVTHTHRCEFALPCFTAASAKCNTQISKAKCTKICWNIENCGNLAFDTWSNLPLPKFAQISKVKFIQLLMRQYLRPGCKSKRDWKFRRVSQQATGSNLWIAWVSSRQRLLLIIKVFSLYDNSTRLNITSTMLPSSGSQLLNRRQATGSNLWIAWADDSFPSDNALSVPLVIFFMTVVSSDRLLTSRGIWFQSMSEWMSGYISADFPACQECPTLVENNYHQYLLLQSSFPFVCTVVSHQKSVYQR